MPPKQIRIFYIDDEAELCENFADLHQSETLEVLTFVDPGEAIQQSRSTPPDLLFVDYRLPGTTGDEVAAKFAAEIPKILVTGDLTINLEYQFEKIISKPYKRTEIEQMIKEFRDGRLSKGSKAKS